MSAHYSIITLVTLFALSSAFAAETTLKVSARYGDSISINETSISPLNGENLFVFRYNTGKRSIAPDMESIKVEGCGQSIPLWNQGAWNAEDGTHEAAAFVPFLNFNSSYKLIYSVPKELKSCAQVTISFVAYDYSDSFCSSRVCFGFKKQSDLICKSTQLFDLFEGQEIKLQNIEQNHDTLKLKFTLLDKSGKKTELNKSLVMNSSNCPHGQNGGCISGYANFKDLEDDWNYSVGGDTGAFGWPLKVGFNIYNWKKSNQVIKLNCARE